LIDRLQVRGDYGVHALIRTAGFAGFCHRSP
jgi:hypothetical protein